MITTKSFYGNKTIAKYERPHVRPSALVEDLNNSDCDGSDDSDVDFEVPHVSDDENDLTFSESESSVDGSDIESDPGPIPVDAAVPIDTPAPAPPHSFRWRKRSNYVIDTNLWSTISTTT